MLTVSTVTINSSAMSLLMLGKKEETDNLMELGDQHSR